MDGTGAPANITLTGTLTIYLVFAQPYTLTEKYVDDSGVSLQPDTSDTALLGDTYTYSGSLGTILVGSDVYVYQGYKVGSYTSGGTLDGTGTPTIASVTSDESVYLVYTLSYTLTYDDNGGNGDGPSPELVTVQNGYTLAMTPAPTHIQDSGKDVVFIGWTAAPDMNIYSASDTAPVTIATVDITSDTTVYAVWGYDENGTGIADVLEATITYDANAGTGTMAPQVVLKGTVQTLALNTFAKMGSIFNGWNTAANGSSTPYADGGSITLTSDITLYAQWIPDPSVTASIDVEYYFDGVHDSTYDVTVTPQILATVNQSDVVLATTPTGYMLDTPPTAPTLPDSALNLDGTTVAVYYVTDPSQMASIDVEYYFDGVYDSTYDTTVTPQILVTVNQSDVVLATAPTGYMLDTPSTAPALPASAISLDGTTVTVYYVTDPSQTASIDIEYYFNGAHNSSYDTTITPQILGAVTQGDVVLGTIPTGYMLSPVATSPLLPASAAVLNGGTVSVYYMTDPSQTASIDVEYYFNGVHDSSYDVTLTPQILATVNQSGVVLTTAPIGYMLDTPPTAPTLPDSALNLDGTTVTVYYVTDPSQTAGIDVEYYFDGVHDSSYDTTFTPQILATVTQSDVVLAATPTGYMLDAVPTVPALPASATSLDGTTVTVHYVADPSQTASIDVEYYFNGVHNSSYDTTITPQILTTVIQSDVVLPTPPTGYMLDTPPTAPVLPDSAMNLDGSTVKVYYVTDSGQTASIDVEYCFDGVHDSSYDTTLTPQILSSVTQGDVVLGTIPTGYMLSPVATSPLLPASAVVLNGGTVSVYYMTDPSQTASINVEYYFDGVHDSSYDTAMTPQILGTVTQSDVVLIPAPTGYMLDAVPTVPALPASAISLDGTTVTVHYVADPSQAVTIQVEYVDRSLTLIGSTTTIVAPYGSSFTAADSTFAGYVLADWSLDGGMTLQGNVAAVIGSVTTNITITLIYGHDRGGTGDPGTGGTPDGIEDILITKEYQTSGGTTLQASDSVVVNLGSTFSDPAPGFTGYTYAGHQINGGALQSGNPSITPAAGALDQTVTYVYGAGNYQVSVNYELRDGTSVPGTTNYQVTQAFGTTFTPALPPLTGYVLAGWKQDGGSLQSGTPSITVPAANTTVTLVYGYDRGGTGDPGTGGTPDGIEDILVTKEYKTAGGTTLSATSTVIINIGDSFTDAHTPITGYTYDGYTVDGGTLNVSPAEPNFPVAAGDSDTTITYIYSATGFVIDVKYELRNGSPVPGTTDFQLSQSFGTIYAPTAAQLLVTDYVLVD